jgi:tRNA pseudouridine55 synthase
MKGKLLSIYKPVGVSSFKALGELKKKYNTKKVGHMGTLDPLAKGVLAVAVGEATKLIPYVVTEPKEYECEITFGIETDTLDAEGLTEDIVAEQVDFASDDLNAVLKGFKGRYDQVPPVYSAVHIDGKRAYDLARKGKIKEGDLKSREVECFEIELISFELPVVKLRLVVGSGFYVRSLVRDVARELKVKAYMSGLKRTKVGEFKGEGEMNVEEVLVNHSRVDLDEEDFKKVRNGVEIAGSGDLVLGYYNNELVAILRGEDSVLKVVKNLL